MTRSLVFVCGPVWSFCGERGPLSRGQMATGPENGTVWIGLVGLKVLDVIA